MQISFAFAINEAETRVRVHVNVRVRMCVYIELTISRLFGEQTWGPATCLGTHFELNLRMIVLRRSRGHMSVSLSIAKDSNKAQDVVATYNQSNVRTISMGAFHLVTQVNTKRHSILLLPECQERQNDIRTDLCHVQMESILYSNRQITDRTLQARHS